MPKISVIVPVYNAEKYLNECVDSILAQTLQDIEVILVDDGSTDNSPAICDEYAEKDSRVVVIHKENGGVSAARNAGLDVVKGEYVAFVDSDDYIDTEMYEKMFEQITEYNCDVVMCDCIKEYATGRELYTHNVRGGFYSSNQLKTEYYPHLLIMENVEYPATISNWLLLFKREYAKKVRYLEGVRYSEDLLFGAKLMYLVESFYYMKGQAYYHYRINFQSATHKFVPDKWDDYLLLHNGICDAFNRCHDFDFSYQIDLCLLFFLYNAVGDILRSGQLSRSEKTEKIRSILNCDPVTDMFERLSISCLPVSKKLKLITWMYKKCMAIRLLCVYYERK